MTATGGSGGMGVVTGSGGMQGSGGTIGAAGSGGAAPPVGDAGPGAMSMGCGAANPAPSGMQMLDVDGMQRMFLVSVPDNYDANKPYKLIFAWHGLGGTAMRIQSGGFYGLKQKAMNSVIFVAAQGLDTSNQVGSGPGWDNMGGRDVKFTSAMLEYMRTTYCIDNERIFSVGMSYGGIMSNTVGCALGDDFRAIAPMSGAGPSGCQVHGTGRRLALARQHGQRRGVQLGAGQPRSLGDGQPLRREHDAARGQQRLRRLSRVRCGLPGRLVRVRRRPHPAVVRGRGDLVVLLAVLSARARRRASSRRQSSILLCGIVHGDLHSVQSGP
jgi:predicted esterase